MTHVHAHTPQTISHRRRTTSITALASACLDLLPPGLYANEIAPPLVPSGLEVPAGHRPFLRGHAVGTQNYICLPVGSSAVWFPVGAQATLFNADARPIISHCLSPNPEEGGMARPTWQHARDTSTIWAAALVGSSDPNFVEPGAISWLLLLVVGADCGPTGGDCLTATTYMHRVHTSGGLAPATGCAEAMDVGAKVFVPYSADYVFYKATGQR